MKKEHAIALRQAQMDIARALQRLERETTRSIEGVRIVEVQRIGAEPLRTVEIDLTPAPAENWVGA